MQVTCPPSNCLIRSWPRMSKHNPGQDLNGDWAAGPAPARLRRLRYSPSAIMRRTVRLAALAIVDTLPDAGIALVIAVTPAFTSHKQCPEVLYFLLSLLIRSATCDSSPSRTPPPSSRYFCRSALALPYFSICSQIPARL